jgi:hypothetical protein
MPDVKTSLSKSFLCVLFLVMFALLASFHFTQPKSAEASSCGTVYLYQALCTYECTYVVAEDKTYCEGARYDHYTAPPANRFVSWWFPVFTGKVDPTGCPTFCY